MTAVRTVRTVKRDVMGLGLGVLSKIAGSRVLAASVLRTPLQQLVQAATKGGFRAAGAVNRTFRSTRNLGKPVRPAQADDTGLFDVTPTDDQRLLVAAVAEFAAEQLRPAAEQPSDDLFARAGELGISMLAVPEELDGLGTQRSVVTNALVAEALAHGDLGLAVAVLAPPAVSTALTLWGDAQQQADYLPAFAGENTPAAALALHESRPLFDPFEPATTATRTPGGFRLDGVKSFVPRVAAAELFIVSAMLDGRPRLFVLESGGVTVEPEPAMGLRGAATGRLHLDAVDVPAGALLGSPDDFADVVRLCRLGWAALAAGTGKAVLDYVIPYVNERQAFGEPISHRQAVAFSVADIAIELEGLRLVMLRAASRAEQGKPYAREVALARKLAADKGMWIGSTGVQLLGGHGFVTEHPVERWYRDLRAVAVMEGIVLL